MKKNLAVICPFCGTINYIQVEESDYNDYVNGKLAQDAFPYLSSDERELLISGVCSSCWKGLFSEEEEDYEPDVNECGYNPYMGCYDFDC